MFTGEIFRRLRQHKGMTRHELSASTGIPLIWIDDFEDGRRGMSVQKAKALCKAIGVNVTYEVDGKKICWRAKPKL